MFSSLAFIGEPVKSRGNELNINRNKSKEKELNM